VIQRGLLAIPTLLIVSIAIFSLVRVMPGDIVIALVSEQSGKAPSEEQMERMRKQLGLDKPFITQYLTWIAGIPRGDLGRSLWAQKPATSELARALPVTIQLGLMGVVAAWIVGLPIGILSAVKQNSAIDYGTRGVSILGVAMPDFWIATLMMLMLSLWLGYSPPLGYAMIWDDPFKSLQQFTLPALIMGFSLSAIVMRMTRSTMLEVIRQDYIRTAWSKGLNRNMVIYRHALKNALIPVVTILGMQTSIILGGAVILETIFGLPGVGRLTFQSITLRDYPQIQANILIIATLMVSMNLLIDLIYGWLDPRIRYG
jgi:peptide/nickel transport system permease protein